jgi:outer membrane protein OmpA-like peptidoglycan-associated protein|tara:strand:- start:53343 stop:53753 length:411 start_codon:yes stop_codon:yes gene_type:complete
MKIRKIISVVVISIILFGFQGPTLFEVHYSKNGKTQLSCNDKVRLDSSVVYEMKNNKNYNLIIIGHSNLTESSVDDTILSYKRAIKAKKYIVSKGIEESRVKCRGIGGKESYKTELGGGDDVENRNRRTVFKIYQN